MNTEFRERPILFSGAMVKAIVEGHKTQTRRVVKPQPTDSLAGMIEWKGGVFAPQTYVHDSTMLKHCPYGQPGDRLWVREAWGHYKGDPAPYRSLLYVADYEKGNRPGDGIHPELGPLPSAIRWRPSIHMPRSASRLSLEIVSVKVERLQEISEHDAYEEGTESLRASHEYWDGDPDCYRKIFRHLWQSIHKENNQWSSNPWVWVLEFKRAGQ
jgi:hypothetical protein